MSLKVSRCLKLIETEKHHCCFKIKTLKYYFTTGGQIWIVWHVIKLKVANKSNSISSTWSKTSKIVTVILNANSSRKGVKYRVQPDLMCLLFLVLKKADTEFGKFCWYVNKDCFCTFTAGSQSPLISEETVK